MIRKLTLICLIASLVVCIGCEERESSLWYSPEAISFSPDCRIALVGAARSTHASQTLMSMGLTNRQTRKLQIGLKSIARYICENPKATLIDLANLDAVIGLEDIRDAMEDRYGVSSDPMVLMLTQDSLHYEEACHGAGIGAVLGMSDTQFLDHMNGEVTGLCAGSGGTDGEECEKDRLQIGPVGDSDGVSDECIEAASQSSDSDQTDEISASVAQRRFSPPRMRAVMACTDQMNESRLSVDQCDDMMARFGGGLSDPAASGGSAAGNGKETETEEEKAARLKREAEAAAAAAALAEAKKKLAAANKKIAEAKTREEKRKAEADAAAAEKRVKDLVGIAAWGLGLLGAVAGVAAGPVVGAVLFLVFQTAAAGALAYSLSDCIAFSPTQGVAMPYLVSGQRGPTPPGRNSKLPPSSLDAMDHCMCDATGDSLTGRNCETEEDKERMDCLENPWNPDDSPRLRCIELLQQDSQILRSQIDDPSCSVMQCTDGVAGLILDTGGCVCGSPEVISATMPNNRGCNEISCGPDSKCMCETSGSCYCGTVTMNDPFGTLRIDSVVIKTGDTLPDLAKRFYDDEDRWNILMDANSDVITSENDLIPGTRLVVPRNPDTEDEPP